MMKPDHRERSDTTTSFGFPFEMEPDRSGEQDKDGCGAGDDGAKKRNGNGKSFSLDGTAGQMTSPTSERSSSLDGSHFPSTSQSNNLLSSPSPSCLSSSSPTDSSCEIFSFSPPLLHGSTGLGRVTKGGRERSISVVTEATSWGGSPNLEWYWNGDGDGKDAVAGGSADIVKEGESLLDKGKGKDVAHLAQDTVDDTETGISNGFPFHFLVDSEGPSGLSAVEERNIIDRTPTKETMRPTFGEAVGQTPRPATKDLSDPVTPEAEEVAFPTPPVVEPAEDLEALQPNEGRSSGPSQPRIIAQAAQQTRSRAHSLARSLVGSVNTQGTDSGSPSAASSIRSGKMGMFKGRLKRSRSSFLAGLTGVAGDEGSSSRPGSQAGSRPSSPVPDGMRTPESATGKGKVKGFVKKYMTRTRSTLSVPMMTLDSPDGGTPVRERSQLDLASIEEHAAKIPRVRSKSLEEPAYILSIPTVASSESPTSSGPMSARTMEVGQDAAIGIPSTSTSSPEIHQTCFFDTLLPRELKLRIFATLIKLHVREHEFDVEIGRFRGTRAKTKRWVGWAAGRREIVKLSRVSKGWRSLAFDGPLWARADLNQFLEYMAPSTTTQILSSVSSFLQTLDLRGWDLLPDAAIRRALTNPGWNMRLESVDLRYCQQLTKETLTGVIQSAPCLRKLNLRGLDGVDWPLIMLLNKHCPQLAYLDVSFCRSAGIMENEDLSLDGEWSSLRSLRIAGGLIGAGVLGGLARCMPNLEVLDLSHSPAIDDEEVLNFVRVTSDGEQESCDLSESMSALAKIVRLRPIQGGLPATAAGDNGLICRRVTRLRHLNLSRCPQLSDQACYYLAHAVPDLEILELALIGAPLKDEGLVALFATTPKIRRVDLEMATDLTDRTIQALTPPKHGTSIIKIAGCDLESLSIGYAGQITTEAIMRLLHNAPKLLHLGLDNTVVSDVVVKEFIRRRTSGSNLSTMNVVDCRHVSRNVVEAFERQTRPRRGWRGWQAVPFNYQDGGRPRTGRDECAEVPVLQSFWTWNKVPRTPASVAMSGEPKNGLREFMEGGEVTPGRGNDERSCNIM